MVQGIPKSIGRSRIGKAILQHLRREIIQVGIPCTLSRPKSQYSTPRVEICRTKYSRLIEYTIYCFDNYIELRYDASCPLKTVALCNPDCFDIIIKALQDEKAKRHDEKLIWDEIRRQRAIQETQNSPNSQ